MDTMRLQATVRPASKLKSILQVIQGLPCDEACMRVNHEAITITLLNRTQTAPFYITLCSDWFINYELDFDPGQRWTICFPLHALCDIVLLHPEDEEQVDIKGNVRDDGSDDGHLIFTFIRGNRRRTHQMDVHGFEPPNLPYMDHSHGRGFQIEIQPRSLVHALENGSPQFFSLYISSGWVMIIVGADQRPYFLTRGSDYDVTNVPEERGVPRVRYSLFIRPEDLVSFHRAIVRSNRIVVMTAPPALNPHPWPVLVAYIDQESTWFTYPFNSRPVY